MSQNNYKTAWRRLLATNTTDTAFDAKAATATEPTAEDDVLVGGRSTLELIPYGAGSANQTMKGRIIGWARTSHDSSKVLWIPDVLCEYTGTLSTAAGVSGYVPADTGLLCDIIAITDGIGVAPAGGNNVAIKLTVDVSNYEKISIVQHNDSSSTSTNALYRLV